MRLKGYKELKNNIRYLSNIYGPTIYRNALLRVLVKIEGNSARRVPVDTGNLRGSGLGNAKIDKVDYKGAKGHVAYTANYAIYVHERTELNHKVGEAKFLQNAINEESRTMVKDLGEYIKSKYKRDLV